ncbi:hypothetical protein FMEAI12_6360003 [Parafrankia sp. Ea1.12]|nr:hypothetical protein FMEAI12_6360003 [Parafrankia sp. Ea1.12]
MNAKDDLSGGPGGSEKIFESGGDLAVAADRYEVHTGEGAAVA